MRPELDLIEKIEKYLKGELSGNEKAEFEKQLSHDPSLQKEVKLQQDIINGIQRAALKLKLKKAYHKYMRGKNFLKWGGSGMGIVVATAGILFFTHALNHNKFTYPLPSTNELGTKVWCDADKYIPGQTFTLDPKKDTVIETKGGMVLAVPANCFLDKDGKPATGPIDLEVKEALDPATIMRAGLSTESNGKLLESAGMFYINGRQNGESLKIDPNNGIYTEIPTDSVRPDMKLFKGVRMPDGTINWVNPKPLIHNLIPVNIHSLNFYPPHYLDSLAKWGYDIHNKKFTDSLYYSFARLFSPMGPQPQQTSVDTMHLTQQVMPNGASEGENLFKQNCTSCHTIGNGMLVGPDLLGVTTRVPQPYKKWLHRYIKNWIAVRKSGDSYANKLYKKCNETEMTIFDGVLTDKQIDDIIDYLSPKSTGEDTLPHFKSDSTSTCGINPAKIKAIWAGNEFQNTLLATREFEARMPYIHETHNDNILDLYVNNVDKRMSYIDSLAAEQLSGDLKTTFFSFAARGDGKVAGKSGIAEKLREFYDRKTKLYTEEVKKADSLFWLTQSNKDSIAAKKTEIHSTFNTERIKQNLREEYTLNLKEACRQVGDKDSIPKFDKQWYVVLCTGTGWENIDAAVYASTATHTTLDYVAQNGKHAIIKYLPFSVQIVDYKKYDKLFVYLLPNKLNSFIRLDDTLGQFKDNLDELMKYKMACIAYKGDQAYFYCMKLMQPKNYAGIKLSLISDEKLNKKLSKLCNRRQSNDMTQELHYLQFEAEDIIRHKKIKNIAELANKTAEFLFPCIPWGTAQEAQDSVLMK